MNIFSAKTATSICGLFFLAILLNPQNLVAFSYQYTLSWDQPHTHIYTVELAIQTENSAFTDFKIPAWRPGRYYLQNYAAAVSGVKAIDTEGVALSWNKIDKDTWRVHHTAQQKIRFSYQYYAAQKDAGSSYLGEGQAYFNPVNMFMYVDGKMDAPVSLTVASLPMDWKAATALDKGDAYNVFTATNYHEFADCPAVFAPEIKTLEFDDWGAHFYIHFHGQFEGGKDVEEELIKNIKKICRAEANVFGGYPFKSYHFIYRLLDFRMRHAVEHSRSSSFALPANVVSSVKATNSLYGITAHEFWHVWNVKRIRPAALWPYDYSQAQYTGLHWFTEGVTDYYTHLSLLRAGLISEETFFRRMAGGIRSIENSYSGSVISPTQSSFDSWLVESSYHHPLHRSSYYGLGQRMGLLIDMELIKRTGGKKSMDDLFQYLYKKYYNQNKGVPEDGVQKALEAISESDWKTYFDKYIHGTEKLDYEPLFAAYKLVINELEDTDVGERKLGILSWEQTSQGYLLKALHLKGDAAQDGLAMEDLIIGINGKAAPDVDIDELFKNLKKGETVLFAIYRDFGQKEIEVKYQGRYTAKAYEIMRKKGKANSLLKTWLGNEKLRIKN